MNRSGRPSFCDELASSVAGTTYLHTAPDDDRNYYWVVACHNGGCSPIDSDNSTQPAAPSPIATAIPPPTPAAGAPAPPTPAAPAPDLVVAPFTVSERAPAVGSRFSLNATVRNLGNASSVFTRLHYYESTDSIVSPGDRLLATDGIAGLAPSGEEKERPYTLTAPSTPGTYYYGACVAAVSGEANTANNCSAAVAVTVGAAPVSTATSTVRRTLTATPLVQVTPTPVSTATRVLTPQSTPTATPTPVAQRTGAPTAPTSVRAVYVDGGHAAKVDWDPVEHATYYQIFINSRPTCSDPGGYWCAEVAGRVAGTSYLDTSTFIACCGDVTHYFVRACNSDGCSSLVGAPTLMATPTPVPSATPTQPPRPTPTPTPLPQPSNVHAAFIKDLEDVPWTKVLISWDPAVESTLDDPDPVRYSVYFSFSNNCDLPNPSRDSGCYFVEWSRGTSVVLTFNSKPKPDTTYYFWIIACNWKGRSPCSNADSPAAINYSTPSHFIAPTPTPTPTPVPQQRTEPTVGATPQQPLVLNIEQCFVVDNQHFVRFKVAARVSVSALVVSTYLVDRRNNNRYLAETTDVGNLPAGQSYEKLTSRYFPAHLRHYLTTCTVDAKWGD